MLRVLLIILLLWTPLQASFADDNFVERKDVQQFIHYMVEKYGFNQQQLLILFGKVKVRPQVISHINKPLEKEPWRLYQLLFVNEWRINHGVEFWNKYAPVLARAEKEYGVPASIIVATIGIETRYGQKMGEYRVIDSLSNLAFSDSPRATFFRKELKEYLLLARDQNFDPLKMLGSYAGAIGQPQFMPSSYRRYAVNFSRSGKIDLMNDEGDVIGSIANYYHQYGWAINEPVAVQAVVMGDRYHYLGRNGELNEAMSIAELARYGVLPRIPVTHDNLKVRVVELDNRYSKEYWLGFRNFFVIKRYNQSDLYAMAVYQLSYYIKTLRERLNKGP